MADPFSVFSELREQAAVYRHGSTLLATRYAEVREIVRDNGVRFGRAHSAMGSRGREARARLTPELQQAYDEMAAFEGLQVVRTDPPEHDRLRAIAHRAFTPARIAALRESAQRYTDELLAPLVEQDVADLSTFGYSLPLMMIVEMLGVPQADRELIHGWTVKLARNKGGAIEPGPLLEARAAAREFSAYVHAMVEEHRRAATPPSPLVADLVDAEAGDRLSTDELVAMFVVLLFGGHETTTNLINIGLYELLRRPEQWRLLCADPGLVPQAVEELLRFVTPVQWLSLVVVQDVELAGATMAEGDTIMAVLAGANRDPAAFERPDELDLTRPDARNHLGLGFGPHFCLGASLVRLEGTTAFATLARRFPGLELAAENVEFEGSALLRSLASLPVRFGADR